MPSLIFEMVKSCNWLCIIQIPFQYSDDIQIPDKNSPVFGPFFLWVVGMFGTPHFTVQIADLSGILIAAVSCSLVRISWVGSDLGCG